MTLLEQREEASAALARRDLPALQRTLTVAREQEARATSELSTALDSLLAPSAGPQATPRGPESLARARRALAELRYARRFVEEVSLFEESLLELS